MEETNFQQPTKDSIIVEIRAGVGGDEAALFAADLFNAYNKYASSQGWNVTMMDESFNELKGYKEVIFKISGQGVYDKFQYEGGVHRVQRIPKTEKSGRIHTSTISVAIMPIPSQTEIQIQPHEIRFETCKSGGAGGQNVNKRETAVRIVHIPTNIAVESQGSRNQQQNRENAMALLRAKLFDVKNMQQNLEMQSQRNAQIGSADRSEKIRTYNFPQDRVTDHRINESWHNIEKIMEGKMDKMFNELAQAFKK